MQVYESCEFLLTSQHYRSSKRYYILGSRGTYLDLSEDNGGAVITRSLTILADGAKLDSLEELIQRTGVEATVGPGQLATLDGEARVALLGTIEDVAPAADVD